MGPYGHLANPIIPSDTVAVILAGGMGIRMGEESLLTPKPMIRIGKMPVIWHVMKILYTQGVRTFLILGGYKVDVIRDFFRHYHEYVDPVTWYGKLAPRFMLDELEKWTIGVVDTGLNTPTAGRLLKIRDQIFSPFILTYADGVANVDIHSLEYEARDNIVTVTAVHAPGRFGALNIVEADGKITDFQEKPLAKDWINGGFMWMRPEVFDFLRPDEMLEQGSLQRVMAEGSLGAYKHLGFWYPMDTGRDKEYLTNLWENNAAPWKVW